VNVIASVFARLAPMLLIAAAAVGAAAGRWG
jgi:hypothetical protein